MKSHLPLNVHFSCPFYPNVLSRYLAWITVIQRKWKFFKVFVVRVWDVSLCLHQSLFIVMMIIIIGDMITIITCFLPWRWISSEQKSRIFLWDQATRPAWPGSGPSLSELSSTTGTNVNRGRQDPTRHLLLSTLLRLSAESRMGVNMWKFPEKSTLRGLPPSHE